MDDGRLRLVGIYGNWSYDEWDEINHPDPAMRRPDTGPGRFNHILCDVYDLTPSPDQVARSLAVANDELSGSDGRYVLIAHATLDARKWRQLVGHDEAGFVGRAWTSHEPGMIGAPEIEEYPSLHKAAAALASTGAEVVLATASAETR